jgi:predicted DNA binding CopG/RHH family protein
MKQPKINNITTDSGETEIIRSRMGKKKSVKITINIDAEVLSRVKSLSDASDVPYQRLINRLLEEGLQGKSDIGSRLDTLEKEVRKIKKQSFSL